MRSRGLFKFCQVVLLTLICLASSAQDIVEEPNLSSFFELDIGSGIWLENGTSPSEANASYATRPWGSWHVGFNWVNNAKLSEHVYLDWGGGVSWFNWQLEDAAYQVLKGNDQVELINNLPANATSLKSKLSATYVGIRLIPMLDLGKEREERFRDDPIAKKGFRDGLRIGVGPYIGYRIGSHSKYVFRNDGKREEEKNKDHFFLENTRYGLRAQMGYREFELFVSYDFNQVFAEGKGPNQAELNNLSVGFTFVSSGK